ncbi:MAG: hypothetical protein K6A38_08260 [Lachnospiraceae bacterium]|nr:hypothetical protein [Lachnospiraceae bacterium]
MSEQENTEVKEVTEEIVTQAAGSLDAKMLSALQSIKEHEELQTKYAKKQGRIVALAAIFCVAIMIGIAILVLSVLPKVVTLLDQANGIATQADVVMKDLNVVTKQLAEADITGMLDDVSSLVVQSEESINDAMKKIDAMDIEGLNNAIADLQDVIAPLARMMR